MTSKRYKLAVFDMDGVLTQPVSSWEYLHKRFGVDNSVNLGAYKSGRLSYIDFLRSDVKLWIDRNGTTSASTVISMLDQIPRRDGVYITMKTLRDNGIKTAIISGGIYWLAEKICESAVFDEIHANRIHTDNLNNIVADGEVMVEPRHKDAVLVQMQERLGVRPEETISVGDTFQDVAMFRHSGLSVAFNPVESSVSSGATFTVIGNDLAPILDLIER